MLEIALLGCGGGMPMPERYLSALLMNYRGRKILVDCGEGTQVSMRLLGWGFKTIDIICISHSHGDHTVGLPGLLATIGNSGRTEELTIIGPEGTTEVVKGLLTIAPYLPYDIKIVENPVHPVHLWERNSGALSTNQELEGNKSKPSMEINVLTLEHSAPCLGYNFYVRRKPKFDVEKATINDIPKPLWSKLQKGEAVEHQGICFTPDMVLGDERAGIKLSFITDTRPIDSIPGFIQGSDLLVCEGTYGDDEDIEKAIKNKHMTFREAAQLAHTGRVKKLLLTHFSPVMQQPELFVQNATDNFPDVVIGQDRHIENLRFEDK